MAMPPDDAPTEADHVGLAAQAIAAWSVGAVARHRTVERVEFDGSWVRRRVTIETEVEESAARQVPVPLALIGKDERIIGASALDEGGTTLPLMTHEETAAAAFAGLKLAVDAVGGVPTADEEALLLEVALAPPLRAEQALARLARARPWWFEESIQGLANIVATQTVVCALLDGPPGRRLIRLEWEQLVTGRRAQATRAALAGAPANLFLTLHALRGPGSSHLDVVAPGETEITAVTPVGADVPAFDAAGSENRAHAYTAAGAGTQPHAVLVGLRPARQLTATAALAAAWSAATLLAAAIWPDRVGNDEALLVLLAAPLALLVRHLVGIARTRNAFDAALLRSPLIVAAAPPFAAVLYAVVDPARPARPVLIVGAVVAALQVPSLLRGLTAESSHGRKRTSAVE